jgi:threonine dehydratase
MLGLSEAERERGVVAVSGGNFAQAVAYAGRVLGVRSRIIMADNTPANYVQATQGYGAEVELVPTIQDAFDRAERYRSRGWAYLHAYDNPLMMAGNGTIGLELLEEVPDLTDVFISIGGGGLIGGITTALKGVRPEVRVWGVETEGADGMSRALAAGEVVPIQPTSLAKTLGAPYVAGDALQIVEHQVEEVRVVSDAGAYHALKFLLERAKLMTELAAACTLAAAEGLADRFGPNHHVVMLLCGGNASLGDICVYKGEFEEGVG